MKIAVDWDGVIHSYVSGWQGHTNLPDDPVEGAIAWLAERHMAKDEVIVYSCRFTNTPNGNPYAVRDACIQYLIKHGLPTQIAHSLEWWIDEGKPMADIYLDDRGVRFRGKFPTGAELQELKDPWNKNMWVKDGQSEATTKPD